MKSITICFTLALLPFVIKGHCILSPKKFSCKHTNYRNFQQTFYELSCLMDNLSSTLTITIEDSGFEQIKYFPKLSLVSKNVETIQLTIKNSSIEEINDDAFQELTSLERLDLSHNKLKYVTFVNYLSTSLEALYINNNNISYLNNSFERLKTLKYLDLSYNLINVIEFSKFIWIQRLNFNHNRIDTLKPMKSNQLSGITDIDLSHNKIKTFSEAELNIQFSYIDISHNQLKFVSLNGGRKRFVCLSGNNISQLITNQLVEIDSIDLSSSKIILNFTNINMIPRDNLILSNNKLGVLNESKLNIFTISQRFRLHRPKIDISNSSIDDIPPYYFDGLQTNLLNLSNNDIILLRNNVFFNSVITTLDLSNSSIERVQKSAFKNLRAATICLKRNKLKVFYRVFTEMEVTELDLSFNLFQAVTNHSFVNCRGLVKLNLEHCLIEKMEPDAFSGLENLRELILANNKLYILETNTFSGLPMEVLNLEGSRISSIKEKAFNNLPNIKGLNLSNITLINLDPYAFYNLPEVTVVDLSYNNVSIIPHYLFVNMQKLRTVHLNGNYITTFNSFQNTLKLRTLTISLSEMFISNLILNSEIRYLLIKDSKINILRNDTFESCYNLIELHFNNSSVLKVEADALNNLFNLKFLDSQNLFKYTKYINEGSFKDLRTLEFLNLSGLSLKRLSSKTFVGMVSLETLLLNDNNLNTLQKNTFFGLKSLKMLNLSSCGIDTYDNDSFNGLNSLEVLYLDYNNLLEIESQFLFECLRNLTDLHLEYNNINYLNTKTFSGLKELSRLHLQNNNLTELPIGVFQDLTKLKLLNLSGNNIKLLKSGHLSNLGSLVFLDLSYNQLEKLEHVDTFFSLKKLSVVRFDGNHLKQFDFRRFLINLVNIRYVGISFNKWKCETLSLIIENFNNKTIEYTPIESVFESDNVDGIGCVDICKFIYCFEESVEKNILDH